jgi:hypothetical protein
MDVAAELDRLLTISEPAERLHAATRLLIELEDLTLRVARIRRETVEQLTSDTSVTSTGLNDDANALLGWIRRNEVQSFSAREAFASLSRSRFPSMDSMRATLDVLETLAYIQRCPSPPRRHGQPGRHPSPVFKVRHISAVPPS